MYKLLSHNDLDGVGCGILAKIAFGSDVKVRYNSVSGLDREVEWFLDNEVDQDISLFITDLSVNKENEERLEQFYQSGGKVQLIDHHKTAIHLNDYEWGRVIVEQDGRLTSATSLFYEYLVEQGHLEQTEALSEFVDLVRQYDTWEWEKNNNLRAQRLNALFYLVTIEEFETTMIARLTTREAFDFSDFEKKILDMEEEKIDRYIRRKRRELVQTKIVNHLAGIVYAESYHSELGNELGKECPHLDYIAIINIGGKRLGFRTIHDHVDVSEVAATYGGGGHAKASGASLTEEAFQKFVLETYELEPLREDARHNRFNLKESSFGSLYKDLDENLYFVHKDGERWVIDQNEEKMAETFLTFVEAETYLKRNFAAWLVRDETFVQYLMDKVAGDS